MASNLFAALFLGLILSGELTSFIKKYYIYIFFYRTVDFAYLNNVSNAKNISYNLTIIVKRFNAGSTLVKATSLILS